MLPIRGGGSDPLTKMSIQQRDGGRGGADLLDSDVAEVEEIKSHARLSVRY